MRIAIILLYLLGLFYYSLYGYTRAISEYFCIQKRPGETTYQMRKDFVSLIQFEDKGDPFLTLSSNKNDCIWESCLNPYDKESEIKFKGNAEIVEFAIKRISEPTLWSKGTGAFPTDGLFELKLILLYAGNYESIICSGGFGERKASSWIQIEGEGGFPTIGTGLDVNSNTTFDRCIFETKPIDCTAKPSMQNFYLGLFTISSIVLILLLFISKFNLRFRLCLKIFVDFFGLDNNNEFKFCNPLDDSYGVFMKGQRFITGGQGLNEDELMFQSNSFNCKNFLMTINSENVLKVYSKSDKMVKCFLFLDENKAKEIKSLFYFLNEDIMNWPIDETGFHYYSVSDFIKNFICGDKKLSFKESESDRYIKTVKISEILLTSFNVSEGLLKFLVVHNKMFFKTLNFPSLIQILKNKTGWGDKPQGIGNSQWKRYTNDTYLTFVKLGYNVKFNQLGHEFKPTETLLNCLKSVDLNDKEIEDNFFEENLNKELEEDEVNDLKVNSIIFKNFDESVGILFDNYSSNYDDRFKDNLNKIKNEEDIGEFEELIEKDGQELRVKERILMESIEDIKTKALELKKFDLSKIKKSQRKAEIIEQNRKKNEFTATYKNVLESNVEEVNLVKDRLKSNSIMQRSNKSIILKLNNLKGLGNEEKLEKLDLKKFNIDRSELLSFSIFKASKKYKQSKNPKKYNNWKEILQKNEKELIKKEKVNQLLSDELKLSNYFEVLQDLNKEINAPKDNSKSNTKRGGENQQKEENNKYNKNKNKNKNKNNNRNKNMVDTIPLKRDDVKINISLKNWVKKDKFGFLNKVLNEKLNNIEIKPYKPKFEFKKFFINNTKYKNKMNEGKSGNENRLENPLELLQTLKNPKGVKNEIWFDNVIYMNSFILKNLL